jgi:hypothetical protein
MITLSVNGLDAVSVRLWHPWTGAWSAEVDFDLEAVPKVPSGAVVLKIGDAILSGTVDPDASGRFGEKARARIIGGAGGWHRNVPSRQFHNDAGVFSAAVISATAAELGEKVVVTTPAHLGVDYERVGPAPGSRVLAGQDWWISLAGVTTVGPRAPAVMSPDVDVLTWDPHMQRAEFATDGILMPGTVLVDPRFGKATARDVEQTFTKDGARGAAWCGTEAKPRIATLLSSLVREAGQTGVLKTYRYRVVAQNPLDGRITLQAVSKAAGAPDSIALPPWYGVPGLKSLVTPGTEAAVVFLDGDPAQPAVISFLGGDELSSGIATELSMKVLMTELTALCAALQAFLNFPLIAAFSGGTAQPSAAAAALLGATAALPTNYSLKTKAP